MSEYSIQCSSRNRNLPKFGNLQSGPRFTKARPPRIARSCGESRHCVLPEPRSTLLRARSGSGEMELLPPFLYIPLTMRIRVEADNPRSSTLQLEQIASGNVGLASGHPGIAGQEHRFCFCVLVLTSQTSAQ